MPPQDKPISHEVLNRFKILLRKKRLGHAYIFNGPAFGGKKETALAIAEMILCEDESRAADVFYCGQCPQCQKIEQGVHPDVHVLQYEEEETIKIDMVREFFAQIKLRSFYGKQKIFIIRDVDNLTIQAGNALLKMLEEPNSGSLLLLTTSNIDKVLGTIISRCHVSHFLPASETSLAESLTKYYDEKPIHANFLAYMAEGCLGKALHWRECRFCQKRDQVVKEYILSSRSDTWLKKILADRRETKEVLHILLSWFRDALLLKLGMEKDILVHVEWYDELKRFTEGSSFDEIKQLYDHAVETARSLTGRFNVKVPLLIIKEKLWKRSLKYS